jgi:hypothetical protein
LAIFVYAYKIIGAARKRAELAAQDERLIWALGSTLLATTVAFFGIVYFDQSFLSWYALLAMIAAAATFPADDEITQLAASTSGKNSPWAKKMFGTQPVPATAPLRLWHHEL